MEETKRIQQEKAKELAEKQAAEAAKIAAEWRQQLE